MADETLVTETAETETTTETQTPPENGGVSSEQQTQAATQAQTETTTEAPAFDFNKDWRAALSKGDTDLGKFLGRYATPEAAIKKFKEINDDIKAGKYRKPLGEDATDEEKAAFRKEQGIPDDAAGYYDKLPDGLVVGDDDKPNVDKFMAAMHEAGAPPSQVNAALAVYYDLQQQQAEEQADLVAQTRQEGEDALAQEWGADKKRNLNAVKAYVSGLPKEVALMVGGGTVKRADGTEVDVGSFYKREDGKLVPMGNSPEFVKWLAGLALEANPLATVVPGAGANQASAIADEIAAIEKVMREDRTSYNRDEKMQARYRELIDARLRLEAKG